MGLPYQNRLRVNLLFGVRRSMPLHTTEGGSAALRPAGTCSRPMRGARTHPAALPQCLPSTPRWCSLGRCRHGRAVPRPAEAAPSSKTCPECDGLASRQSHLRAFRTAAAGLPEGLAAARPARHQGLNLTFRRLAARTAAMPEEQRSNNYRTTSIITTAGVQQYGGSTSYPVHLVVVPRV